MGAVVLCRDDRGFAAFEYFFIAAAHLFGVPISFSTFHIAKLLISFLFFVVEVRLRPEIVRGLAVLTYFMGSERHPCHALIGLGEDVYHYTLAPIDNGTLSQADAAATQADATHATTTPADAPPQSDAAPTQGRAPAQNRDATSRERSFELVPCKSKKVSEGLRDTMFFAPCVGFASPLLKKEDDILERLAGCGKCQDWACVALYVLSCHKYLSYACVLHLRWLTWVCFAFVLGVKIMVVYLKNVLGGDADHNSNVLNGVSYVFLTMAHMSLTTFDIINIRRNRLQGNDTAVLSHFRWRGVFFEFLKFTMLFVVLAVWTRWVPQRVSEWDYFIYFFLCILVGAAVHIITINISTQKAL